MLKNKAVRSLKRAITDIVLRRQVMRGHCGSVHLAVHPRVARGLFLAQRLRCVTRPRTLLKEGVAGWA